MSRFPSITFGKCPVCGGAGEEDANASGADASPSRTAMVTRAATADAGGVTVSTANGFVLELYDGEFMCRLCIKEKKADNESEISTEKHENAQEFRDNAGFKRNID